VHNKAARVVVVGLVLGLILSFLLLLIPWLPGKDSVQAGRTDALIWAITYVSCAIFGVVMAIMLYSLWRFRSRGPDDLREGSPVHGHTGLEIFWTLIPTAIVTIFGVWAGIALTRNDASAASDRQIEIEAYQYGWNFSYPDDGGFTSQDALYVPVNQKIVFSTISKDVIHAFYVPEWRLQMSALPGEHSQLVATPTRTGVFRVECTQLCGPGHGGMSNAALVHVVSQQDFQSWVAKEKQASAGQSAGEKVFVANGCGSCHTFAPAKATGTIGPSLDDLAAAAQKAGKQPQDFVHQSIVDPNAYIAPGYPANVMPQDFGTKISSSDLDALVNYLLKGASK
jgi:cytochrome c oxidase subunit 2